jgi:hypothetical protein
VFGSRRNGGMTTVEALGRERGIRAEIAHDGMEVVLT